MSVLPRTALDRARRLQHFQLLLRPPKCRRRKFRPLSETGASTSDIEHVGNLLGKNSFAGLPFAPARVVEVFTSAHCAESVEDLRFALRKMFVKPMLEQWRDRPGQSQQ